MDVVAVISTGFCIMSITFHEWQVMPRVWTSSIIHGVPAEDIVSVSGAKGYIYV